MSSESEPSTSTSAADLSEEKLEQQLVRRLKTASYCDDLEQTLLNLIELLKNDGSVKELDELDVVQSFMDRINVLMDSFKHSISVLTFLNSYFVKTNDDRRYSIVQCISRKEFRSSIFNVIKTEISKSQEVDKEVVQSFLFSYFTLLDKLTLSSVFYELLILNGGFGMRMSEVQLPKWFNAAVGSKLSSCLMAKNGLFHFFVALDDLGGESFWQNSVVLSVIAKLLSTKPMKAESYEKYAQLMFGQFLDVMKIERSGQHVAMLFALTVENLYLNDKFLVEVQLVDKLIRPWEMLLERGLMNELSPVYGLWDANLDGSIIILKTWLSVLPKQTVFTSEFHFGSRFLQFVPLWLYLCGQAMPNPETKPLADDLLIILSKLMLEKVVLEPRKLLDSLIFDGKHEFGYFVLTKKEEPKVTEVVPDKRHPHHQIKLIIDDEPLDEEAVIDFKIDAVKQVLSKVDKKMALRSLTLLMTDCLKRWLDNSKIDIFEDGCRFVPELETRFQGKDGRIAAVYVMGSVTDYLGEIDVEYDNDVLVDILNIVTTIFDSAVNKLKEFDGVHVFTEDVEESIKLESTSVALASGMVAAILTNAQNDPDFLEHLKQIGKAIYQYMGVLSGLTECPIKTYYSGSYDYCEKILSLLKDDLNLLSEKDLQTEPAKKMTVSKSGTQTDMMTQWKELLTEEEEAIKGGVLIEIAKFLRNKNTKVFAADADFEWIWDVAHKQAVHTDSYIFLAAINVLVELAYWKADPYLERLVEKFAGWSEVDELKDIDLMFCGKLGEAMAKLFARSGDYSTYYFDRFSNALLNMMKAKDEIIRASALSGLSELIVATRGRRFTAVLGELLFMISQFLKTDDSALVRRASIQLLKCIVESNNQSILESLGTHLKEMYRLLRQLWLTDKDEVVRMQAEMALLDLKDRLLQ